VELADRSELSSRSRQMARILRQNLKCSASPPLAEMTGCTGVYFYKTSLGIATCNTLSVFASLEMSGENKMVHHSILLTNIMSQQWSLRRIWSPGALGEGQVGIREFVRRRRRRRRRRRPGPSLGSSQGHSLGPSPGPSPGPSQGPSRAQVGSQV